MKNHSTRFYTRYKTFLETYEIQDWKTLLDGYRPRKPIYRQIKELLLRAETIDFEVPFRLSSKDGYNCMFEHCESFLVVDRTDSAFVNGYIQMLNDCSNDYDIKSAYQHTVAEQGNIELFDEGIPHRLNRLEEFVSDLNELLTELLNMEKIAVLQAKDHYLPKFAIIGYAQEDNDYRNEHYFSYHEVAGTKLTAGMPLTKGTARNIFTCLEDDLIKFRLKGMLPKNLIHFDFKGSFQLIWYAHPK